MAYNEMQRRPRRSSGFGWVLAAVVALGLIVWWAWPETEVEYGAEGTEVTAFEENEFPEETEYEPLAPEEPAPTTLGRTETEGMGQPEGSQPEGMAEYEGAEGQPGEMAGAEGAQPQPMGEPGEMARGEQPMGEPGEMARGEGEEPQPVEAQVQPVVFTVTEVVAKPMDWTGKKVSGEVTVTSVPTDRGFFVTTADSQQEIFVVLDEWKPEALRVQKGHTLEIREATVRDASALDEISGDMDQTTRDLLKDQAIFLTTDANDIRFVSKAGG